MNRATGHAILGESAVRGGRRTTLQLELSGERVPGILLLPLEPRPAPAALLVHGYSSRKERMADSVGVSLLERGIASLGLDLPVHGERTAPLESMSTRNPIELVRRWKLGLAECAAAIRWMGQQPDLDGDRLAIVGYSLGSFLSVIVAAGEPAVRAIVLAAGGDLPPGTPFEALIRTVADPVRAVHRLSGRPLLMVHGRRDRTVHPAQAQQLYDAAREPKELRWYDAGHHLPAAAIDEAADWLGERLRQQPRMNADRSAPSENAVG
jgi:fermentation-respiration switch protein FrsA (DUF1100 family)